MRNDSKHHLILIDEFDNDPLAGMANLFDLGMVFAVALMVALVTHLNIMELFTHDEMTMVKNPGKADMEIIMKRGKKITKYKAAEGAGSGKGKKVGTAYQLENGEIIYIPE